jgi:hypothetical protein
MKKRLTVFMALAVSIMILSSCAGSARYTSTMSTWKDETYSGGKMTNVMVIAAVADIENRKLFEETFVTQLVEMGVKAVTSIEVFGLESRAEKAAAEEAAIAIKAEADKRGMSHVIITFLAGVREERMVTPEARAGMDDVYASAIGADQSSTIVSLTTSVYEVKTEKKIWTRASESLARRDVPQLIKSVVNSTIGHLSADGLI